MKLPHWLRHRWGPWRPWPTDIGSQFDHRQCAVCGRRKVRLI